MQIRNKLLLSVSFFWLACNIDPIAAVKEANVMTMQRPWHEHTVEDPDKSTHYSFVGRPGSKFGWRTKEMCVALDVEPNSALKKTYDKKMSYYKKKTANPNSVTAVEGMVLHRAFLAELSKAKVLCISRYRDRRNKKKPTYQSMFSYFDGTAAHRAFCWKENNSYVCRNSQREKLYEIKDLSNFKLDRFNNSVSRSIASIGYRYDRNRKMLGVRNFYLARQQKAFYPGRSYEKNEYKYRNVVMDGNQQKRFVKVIPYKDLVSVKTGKPILSECAATEGDGGSINVTGFSKVHACFDELSPWEGYCKFWHKAQKKNILNNRKINACKLKGRGMLIKQDNGKLLRVTNCEHQQAAQHFYCSGKLEYSDKNYKVYYEHYGVDLKRKKQNPNCPEQQTLVSGRSDSSFDWDEYTTESYKDTMYTVFARTGYPKRHTNHCFALEAEQDGDLMTARQASIDNYGREYHDAYMKQISLAKVLCISKYFRYVKWGDFKSRNMYSYYTGGSDGKKHRAQCWQKKDSNDFICRGEDNNTHVIFDGAEVQAKFGGKDVVAKILKIKDYDAKRKMLRLKPRHLAAKQIAFHPGSSQEKTEYSYRDMLVDNREQARFVQVIETIKSRKDHKNILPLCQGSGNNITGFAEKKVCDAEFGVFNYYCDDYKDKTINVCKMEKGRGILIKKDSGDILRVVSCEYQSAAAHFYCSGKIGKDGKMKMYFERYGVYGKKVNIASLHRCPDTNTTVVDDKGNEVPPPLKKEEEEEKTAKTATKTCSAGQAIDNCVCNSPLLTHAGMCLQNCPAGYEQKGTGCKKVQITPPAPSKPDCTNGQAVTACNCIAPMHESSGLCCESDQEAQDGQCVTPPPTCEMSNSGMAMTDDCICTGKTLNGLCYTACPEGTKPDDNDSSCVADVVPKCQEGSDVDTCDCSGDMHAVDEVVIDGQEDSGIQRCCPKDKSMYSGNSCLSPEGQDAG